ncbi:uncharacterized protein Dana_GF22251 [Drosophila ananassae]|uniref:Protein krueppel n=1 Tax=Drosophila ananassae TaxID=7217 RepID=B3MZ28_DROAN|nr:zinc finger protein 626 [Drosophila ananassae]EDV32872.1 uncharacterized protein Dana_GF22251 [Drosophila ananassae]
MSGKLEQRLVDTGTACLVCLRDEPLDTCSIYGRDTEPPHLRIVDKIRSCTSLQLGENLTTWPDKICRQCHMELTVTYRFREKCAAVEVLRQERQLKMNLEQHHLRLPRTLKIERVGLDLEPGSSVSGAATLTEVIQAVDDEPPYSFQDEGGDISLLPDSSGALVLSLNASLDSTDLVKQESRDKTCSEGEEDKMLALPPWDEDHTPEHLYEIETQLESLVGSPTLDQPPAPPPSNTPRKRPYRRVTPVKYADYQPGSSIAAVPSTKRRHTERSPKICDVCGNTYKYQHALNAHMRRHNNDRPYPCEVCQKAFISNVELRRHMRVHTGQKPYSCRFCDRSFSDFGSSKKHERIHTGERPYVCEVCQKGFAYAHVLSVHRRTHTGKKQFQCPHCVKGFTKKSYLAAHMAQHGGSLADETGPGTKSNTLGSTNNVRPNGRKETFILDSVVLGDQSKVLEECIVTNDFMFKDQDPGADDSREEDAENCEASDHQNGQPVLEHHRSSYPGADFVDVDGYQGVGDLLDGGEFVDDAKYLID